MYIFIHLFIKIYIYKYIRLYLQPRSQQDRILISLNVTWMESPLFDCCKNVKVHPQF